MQSSDKNGRTNLRKNIKTQTIEHIVHNMQTSLHGVSIKDRKYLTFFSLTIAQFEKLV